MKVFNYLFYFILFAGFFLPTNGSFYLPVPGALLKVNEFAFFLLPLVNLCCSSKRNMVLINKNLQKNILLLLAVLIFTEIVVKYIFFDQSVGEAIKSMRLALPMISSLILLYQGIRADIKIVWNVMLCAVSVSVVLSIISLVVDLPIYYNLENDADVLEQYKGRVINANASFGVVALYLLFEDKDKWYNKGKLVKLTIILGLLATVLAFNRTYLALMFLAGIYLSFKNFRIGQILKTFLFGLVFMALSFYLYSSNDVIQWQIDKRILPIVFGEASIQENAIETQRAHIYESIMERINEGYWLVGLPNKKPIFEDFVDKNGWIEYRKTDISFVNLLLRYGVVVLILYLIVLYKMYRWGYFVPVIFWVYFLASFNTDALMNQNSVFFLFLFSFFHLSIYKYKQVK